MIDVKTLPAVRALLEKEQAQKEQQPDKQEFARAPAGNGHEAALKQRSGQR